MTTYLTSALAALKKKTIYRPKLLQSLDCVIKVPHKPSLYEQEVATVIMYLD